MKQSELVDVNSKEQTQSSNEGAKPLLVEWLESAWFEVCPKQAGPRSLRRHRS